MSALAREVNLSETTFPTLTGESSYEMRIFTPRSELAFAGHPSLGTAWVLGAGRWSQTTEGGTVVVEADSAGARMSQPDPAFTDADPTSVAQALGLAGVEAVQVGEAAGLRHLIVATDAPLGGLAPAMDGVAAASPRAGASTVAVVRRFDDRTLEARVFAPLLGVPRIPERGRRRDRWPWWLAGRGDAPRT